MTDTKAVRVRFAPSPTGPLHIGGVRTALFNWLFARHHGGKFILRIEDTDRKRYVDDSLQLIIEGLQWLGLDWDEGPVDASGKEERGDYGPYIQSQRTELYQQWANRLLEQGKAYKCYATPEELERAREVAKKSGKRAGYERLHRFLSDEERQKLEAERGTYVIRFAMPLEGQTEVYDAVRGKVVFDNSELSDNVLLKSDGFPTYHLANVVDDHFMEISHIMRADEWLPSAPLHKQLYDAFGWEMPTLVHLPVVLNPNGKGKLSKRHMSFDADGEKVLVMLHEYREAGYLPEAVVNFLTNIGWSFGDDREIFTTEETIERFDFGRINPSGGAFPYSKMVWMNGDYIRHMDTDTLAKKLQPWLAEVYGEIDRDKLRKITPYIQERLKTLKDAPEFVDFLFKTPFTPPTAEVLIQRKMDAEKTLMILKRSQDILAKLDEFTAEKMNDPMRALVGELGFKAGQVFGTLRWATANQQVSPPLFESMEALGRDDTLNRIQMAIAILEKAA